MELIIAYVDQAILVLNLLRNKIKTNSIFFHKKKEQTVKILSQQQAQQQLLDQLLILVTPIHVTMVEAAILVHLFYRTRATVPLVTRDLSALLLFKQLRHQIHVLTTHVEMVSINNLILCNHWYYRS